MRILRHQIGIVDYQVVRLPASGNLLSVAQSRTVPDHAIDLWSLDKEKGEPHDRAIYIVGTGNPMPTELRDSHRAEFAQRHSGKGSIPTVYIVPESPEPFRNFLGTVVTPSGLVWHVFEGHLR